MRLADPVDVEQVVDGEVDVVALEDPGLSAEELYQKLMRLPGTGVACSFSPTSDRCLLSML